MFVYNNNNNNNNFVPSDCLVTKTKKPKSVVKKIKKYTGQGNKSVKLTRKNRKFLQSLGFKLKKNI